MKIAIIGYGKMGHIIATIAKTRSHSVITVDPHQDEADCKSITELKGQNVDCAIEFSSPTQAVKNIKLLNDLNIKQVIGTTGWYEQLPEIEELINSSQGSLIYGANFSLGVNLFYKIVEKAAKIFNNFPEYDLSLIEYHHNMKADSPSGTANQLANIVLKNVDRKNTLLTSECNRKIEANELQLVSLRCGSFPGEHELILDSSADTIKLKHSARNREGFALGAVIAAEWLKNKQGFFTIDQLIEDLLNVKS